MATKLEHATRSGTFTIPSGQDLYGELTLAGARTSLYLRNKEYFDTHGISEQCVTGVLHDLTKVSLIHCLTAQVPGSLSRGNEGYHFAHVFPHFVISGDHHVTPSEKTIAEIHFQVDDASSIFYDFDAFGFLIDARPYIEQIANANAINREIKTGPDPKILYFTGKREIFSADTALGRISASHSLTHNLGGPGGVWLRNRIFVSIAFKEKIAFHESIFRASRLIEYLGMLIGRPQNILSLHLRVASDDETPVILQVHWSLPPKRGKSHDEKQPHPVDSLLDAVRQPGEFSRVLVSWSDRQEEWREARWRFFNSFAKESRYDIDRLVGAANMFDILPGTAVPPPVPIGEDLKIAKDASKKVFKALPESLERTSVLQALGRIGKSNLKQKIRHRAHLLVAASGKFPDLFAVTDAAVNCRNYYVHGDDKAPFDYDRNFDAVIFFTDTLEFVFATSDLVEAGWDIQAWSKKGSTMSHPFGRYLVTYAARLQMLKSLLSSARPSSLKG